MKLTVLPSAELEASEAAIWYEDRRDGLGGDFLAELRGAFDLIQRSPREPALLESPNQTTSILPPLPTLSSVIFLPVIFLPQVSRFPYRLPIDGQLAEKAAQAVACLSNPDCCQRYPPIEKCKIAVTYGIYGNLWRFWWFFAVIYGSPMGIYGSPMCFRGDRIVKEPAPSIANCSTSGEICREH